ncbi:hypothetical protein [Actinoplanes nipponensis]|uniref:hypothetical protein n=1 Tax=Actinoplanes nipponensis TaxID=135950 RepID=UPI0031EAC338
MCAPTTRRSAGGSSTASSGSCAPSALPPARPSRRRSTTTTSSPLTDNDPEVTAEVTAAFRAHFGDARVVPLDRITASEDFSRIPAAFGTPYCYWGVGGSAPGQPTYPNHSPHFAPALRPTLDAGTEAIVVATRAYLGPDAREVSRG